jgi:hypothetical protein
VKLVSDIEEGEAEEEEEEREEEVNERDLDEDGVDEKEEEEEEEEVLDVTESEDEDAVLEGVLVDVVVVVAEVLLLLLLLLVDLVSEKVRTRSLKEGSFSPLASASWSFSNSDFGSFKIFFCHSANMAWEGRDEKEKEREEIET